MSPTCKHPYLLLFVAPDVSVMSRFPVERWLDKKEDDGRISLDLEPNKKPASKKATGKLESALTTVWPHELALL